MFNIEENLRGALRDVVTSLRKRTEARMVFGHVCWGVLSRPGSFRLTEIITSGEGSLATKYREEAGTSHEDAFRTHIRRFGRTSVLLDWLTLRVYDDAQREKHSGSLRIYSDFAFLLDREATAAPLTVEPQGLRISYPLFRQLLPLAAVKEYSRQLYLIAGAQNEGGGDGKDDFQYDDFQYSSEQLVGARYAARNFLEEQQPRALSDLSKLARLYESLRIPRHLWTWLFLQALQTGFLYVDLASPARHRRNGFVSIGCSYKVGKDLPVDANPVAIVSLVLGSGNQDLRECIQEVRKIFEENRLESELREIPQYRDRPEMNELRDLNQRWNFPLAMREIRDALQRRGSNGTTMTAAFPQWTPHLLVWLAILTERMRDSVHEGVPLSFCFVVADKSEVKDSDLFDIVELLSEEEEGDMLPWNEVGREFQGGEGLQRVLEVVERIIFKRNYAWFQNGRYALLWDATFPRRFPVALLRFKESSWTVFIDNIRMGRAGKVGDLALGLSYIRGDGSGGLVVHGRQILSFRRARGWDVGETKRLGEMEKAVQEAVVSWELEEELRRRITRVISSTLIAIAEDPNAGCMVIICKKEEKPRFQDMGSPWRTKYGHDPLKMTMDELKALMSMDGATCFFLNDGLPTVEFRRLVGAPEKRLRFGNEESERKIVGEGSRKWSSAFAAVRDEVEVVIAVSQDGPVYIYREEDNGVRDGNAEAAKALPEARIIVKEL